MNVQSTERGKGLPLPLFFAPNRGTLRAEGVSVRLGPALALRKVDFRVTPGEQVALVGPNGSGKTSLLLALKGALTPECGRVLLGDGPVERLDLRVGLVFANPEDQGVAPVVEDDVAFGLESQGLGAAEIRARVEQSLRAVGLWALRAAPVHSLSGGQAQSLALAAVLALGARFLLLDEATSMLSPWERDSLVAVVGGLRRQGVGVVQVTHQAEEVLWADRVVALAGGTVAFSGPPESYFEWGAGSLPIPAYEGVRRAAAGAGVTAPPPRRGSDLDGKVLTARRISVRRRARDGATLEAVAKLSLSAAPGDVVLILGRPGAGKTTLLECLGGLLPLSGGRVELRGEREVCGWGEDEEPPPEARRFAGLLFQYPERQLVGRTPREDVAWGLEGGGRSDLAAEALRLAAVPERLWAVPVEQLSRGEKRRVALAGVLARRPEVLLLDEPSVGLDPEGQAMVWEEVAAFRAGGGAVLVATHWPEPALAAATRVVCLDRGQAAFQGPPEHLLKAAAQDDRLRGLLPFSWRLAAALGAVPSPGEPWHAPAREWLRDTGRVPGLGQPLATTLSSASQTVATSARSPSSRS